VLGSSSVGARLAAEVGLPFSFAHFVSPRYAAQILAGYRRDFRPSCWCREPTASLAVTVICADTDAAAERLAVSDDLWHLSSNGGDRGPLLSVEDAEAYSMSVLEKELVREHRRRRFVGCVDRVHGELVALLRRCGVDELVVRTVCHDPVARIHSYELLAESFGIDRQPSSSAITASKDLAGR
jgi:luciferase family oxidoreductase group 1